jgi:hypothetical protein
MMGSRPGPVPPGTDYGHPVSYVDHEPHAIGRWASTGLFGLLWAGAAAIAFWHTAPPSGAALMFWVGILVAAVAGNQVARIRRLQPRRRACVALGIVCLGLPFLLAALLR